MATNGGLIAWLNNLETPAIAITAAVCFALGVVLLNTRLGRDVEEAATDWALRYWAWVSIDLAPGLLHLVMDASRWCLEGVEQGFYRVSEWLRFRSGEGRAVIVAKAIMGLFWFGVTYLLRFAINLLIEPQINPIKHFPVVTVAHKVCLPLTGTLHDFLVVRFGLDKAEAWTFAGGIITSIPGIFGFMVWELKENWKLYASNRQPRRNDAALAAARLSFGNDPEAVQPAAARGAPWAGKRRAQGSSGAPSPQRKRRPFHRARVAGALAAKPELERLADRTGFRSPCHGSHRHRIEL
jgi:hypothetical protein